MEITERRAEISDRAALERLRIHLQDMMESEAPHFAETAEVLPAPAEASSPNQVRRTPLAR